MSVPPDPRERDLVKPRGATVCFMALRCGRVIQPFQG